MTKVEIINNIGVGVCLCIEVWHWSCCHNTRWISTDHTVRGGKSSAGLKKVFLPVGLRRRFLSGKRDMV